jgi:hypothetical protein
MAKYFCGTRTILGGRNTTSVEWMTNLPGFYYNSTLVDGYVNFPTWVPLSPAIFARIPFVIDAPPANNLFVRFDIFPGQISFSALSPWLVLVNASGTEVIRVVVQGFATTVSRLQAWNGSAWVDIGSSFANSPTDTLTSVQFQFNVSGTSLQFNVWYQQVLISSQSITLPATVGDISSMTLYARTGQYRLSMLAASSFDMRGYLFPTDRLTATGTFNDGSGTVAATNDGDLATIKTLPGVDDKYSGTKPSRTFPSGYNIESVTVSAVMRAASPVTQARTLAVVSATPYEFASNFAFAPDVAFAYRAQDWINKPTGGVWTQSDYNATEFGHVAKA